MEQKETYKHIISHTFDGCIINSESERKLFINPDFIRHQQIKLLRMCIKEQKEKIIKEISKLIDIEFDLHFEIMSDFVNKKENKNAL